MAAIITFLKKPAVSHALATLLGALLEALR
jgi:hypothetical protein